MAIITLSKPITAHGQETQTLEFRAPSIRDLKKHGNPYTASPAAGIDVHPDRILAWAATLAGVNPAALEGLAWEDYPVVEAEVMGFFGNTATSTTPTPAPST